MANKTETATTAAEPKPLYEPEPIDGEFSLNSFVGKKVFIRTITQYYTGLVMAITKDGWILLEGTAWIAVTGRFANMLVDGSLSEVEPYPETKRVFVQIPFIVDICTWNNPLPREQK